MNWPIIMVRKVADEFEYYIQQGNKKLHFTLPSVSHEFLKQAILLAEMAPERRSGQNVVIPLKVAEGDQKSSAG